MTIQQMFEEERQQLREEGVQKLKELAPEGSHLYIVLRHTSQSGMVRHISAFVIQDNYPICLDRLIVKLGLFKLTKGGEAMLVHGCGMDMGFHVVYETARAVYGNGYTYKYTWL